MSNLNGKSGTRTFMLVIAFTVFLFGCAVPEPKTAQPVSAVAIAAGDIENGRDLFMGYTHFENEGPPCIGCHSIGDNGVFGGGSMGPNLTNVSREQSQTALASILSNFGSEFSPVMKPIYTRHPLTVNEQADLIAFMIASEGQPETDKELVVVGLSLAGSAAATFVLGFFYRGRMRGARKPLVKKAISGK